MEEIDLRDFFKHLKKFIIPMVVVGVLAVAGILFYDLSVKTPLYTASTTVVLAQSAANETATTTLNDINVNQKLVSTYSEIVKSRRVLQQAIDELGLDMTAEQLAKQVKVSAIDDTEIIRISVAYADQSRAAEITDKIAEIFTKEIADIYKLNNVNILDEAKTPEKPSNDTTIRDTAIAALIAVFGVMAIAFVIFYFDDTVKYNEDLEKAIQMPIAGRILKSDVKAKAKDKKRKKADDEIVVERYPKAGVSESIKSLRTNLQFSSVDNGFKTILITSSAPSEGKSFVSANLAVSFAQTGKKVLLVDCDLRKGRLHKIFGVPNVPGISNLLVAEIDDYKSYVNKTKFKNLSVITRGSCPPNPSELLSSNKNKALIETLREHFDIIIFDGAPCGSVTDSVIMATLVDEVLVVTRDAATPKAALEGTRDALTKVNARIAGVVMNAVNRKSTKYYGYYGYYGDK